MNTAVKRILVSEAPTTRQQALVLPGTRFRDRGDDLLPCGAAIHITSDCRGSESRRTGFLLL